MKKLESWANILLMMTACVVLTGCGHEHSWTEATCTQAKVCSECGATEGEPAGHDFAEATCTEAKTCKVCGESEGTAKGHDFAEATCAEPKTCKECGITEGDTLEHEWVEASFTAPKTCSACGATEGGMYVLEEATELYDIGNSDAYLAPGGYVDSKFTGSGFSISYYDFDGNLKVEIPFKISSASSRTHTYRLMEDCIAAIYTNYVGGKDSGSIVNAITVTDYEGNVIDTKNVTTNVFDIVVEMVNRLDGYYVFGRRNGSTVAVYDINEQKFVDASTVEEEVSKFAEYSYYAYCPEADCYVVGLGDDYGYADKDGNIIKMYNDASAFSTAGYAFIVDDAGNVSMIDKNLEVVKENFAVGTSVSTAAGREYLYVKNDGKYVYYRITMSDQADAVSEDVSAEDTEEAAGTDTEDDFASDAENVSGDNDTCILERLKEGDTVSLGQTVQSSKGDQFEVQYWLEEDGGASLMGRQDTKGWDNLTLGSDDFYMISGFSKEDILAIDTWNVFDGSNLNPNLDMNILYLKTEK